MMSVRSPITEWFYLSKYIVLLCILVPGNLTKIFSYCDQVCDIENVTNGSNFSFKFLKYIDSACYLIGIHNHKSLTHILILLINTNSYFQENTEGIKKIISYFWKKNWYSCLWATKSFCFNKIVVIVVLTILKDNWP